MKKARYYTMIGLGTVFGFLFLVLFGSVAYLHTDHAQNLALQKINRQINGTLGWDELTLTLFSGKIECQRIAVHDSGENKILQADTLGLNWSWWRLLQGDLVFQAMVEKPILHLIIDSEKGLNLARVFSTGKSKKKEQTDNDPLPLNLVISSFRLTDGQLTYEADKSRLFAEFHNVDLVLNGDQAEKRGEIALTIGGGRISTNGFRTTFNPSSLSGKLVNNQLAPIDLQISTAAGEARLTGRIDHPFESPHCDLEIHTAVNVDEIAPLVKQMADLGLEGKAKADLLLNGPLENPTADFRFFYDNPALENQTNPKKFIKIAPNQVMVRAKLSNRLVSIDPITILSGESRLSCNGQIDLRPVFNTGFFEPAPKLENATLTGKLTLKVPDLSSALPAWGIGPAGGSLQALGNLNGTLFRPIGDLHLEANALTYDNVRIGNAHLATVFDSEGRLQIGSLIIENQGSTVNGTGAIQLLSTGHTLRRNPPLNLQISFTNVEPGDFIDGDLVRGSFNGKVALEGSIRAPLGELYLNSKQLGYKNYDIGNIEAELAYVRGQLAIKQALLVNNDTKIHLTGNTTILDPDSFTLLPNPDFRLSLTGEKVHLQTYLPGWRGDISVKAKLEGNLNNCHGPIEVTGQHVVSPWQSVDRLVLNAQLEGQTLAIDKLALSPGDDEWIEVSGRIDRDNMDNIQIATDGLSLTNIQPLRNSLPIKGKLTTTLNGNGPFKNPTIDGSLLLKQVLLTGKPINDIQAAFDLNNFKSTFNIRHPILNLSGYYHVSKKQLSASAHIQAADLSPYFTLIDQPDLGGRLYGDIKIDGHGENLNNWAVSGTLTDIQLDKKERPVLKAARVPIDIENGRLNIPGWDLALLEKGNLHINGQALLGNQLGLTITGHLPLEVGRLFGPPFEDLKGDLQLDASVKGPWKNPDLRGNVVVKEGAFILPAWGGKLHGINGTIILRPDRVTVPSLSGFLDDGRFRLDGTLALDDFRPGKLALALDTTHLPVRIPDQLDIFLTSHLKLEGIPAQSSLKGTIDISDGMYFGDILINPMEMLKPKKKRAIEPKNDAISLPYFKNLGLDVSISSRHPFQVENNMAELEAIPNLKIIGTLNKPDIAGQTNITEGTIRLWNRQFQITRGTVNFVDPYSLRPGIDIRASTAIRGWEIIIALTGPVDNLELKLISNPAEQSGDILALILTGRTSREMVAGKSGSAGTSGAALAALAGTPLGQRLKKAAGIDTVAVDTITDTDEDTEKTRVTLGKNLSNRMILKYQMETKEGALVQKTIAEYQLLENILVSGFQDSNGIYGGALRYRIEFR